MFVLCLLAHSLIAIASALTFFLRSIVRFQEALLCMITTTRSGFVAEMLLFFQSHMQTCADLSWDCPVAAQEERDEDKLAARTRLHD